MRFRALATDYDGTLATSGKMPPATRAALQRWRASGRTVVLVTGRELSDFARACPELELFDRVLVENGAVLHVPELGETRLLCEPVPDALVIALRRRGVLPLGLGRAILAASRSHGPVISEVAAEIGVEITLEYNKGAVMVSPRGVDKASGVAAALAELGLDSRGAVAVGDAENDLSFLRACGRSVAVANALPEVRAAAHHVTRGTEGEGVAELVDELLESDR